MIRKNILVCLFKGQVILCLNVYYFYIKAPGICTYVGYDGIDLFFFGSVWSGFGTA